MLGRFVRNWWLRKQRLVVLPSTPIAMTAYPNLEVKWAIYPVLLRSVNTGQVICHDQMLQKEIDLRHKYDLFVATKGLAQLLLGALGVDGVRVDPRVAPPVEVAPVHVVLGLPPRLPRRIALEDLRLAPIVGPPQRQHVVPDLEAARRRPRPRRRRGGVGPAHVRVAVLIAGRHSLGRIRFRSTLSGHNGGEVASFIQRTREK